MSEAGEGLLGERVQLFRGDGLEGVEEIGGEPFIDAGGHHLAVAVGHLEDAVDAAFILV